MVRPGTEFNSPLGLVAHRYKPRRNKLKSHDSGEDRHNKGVAFLNKVTRLDTEYKRESGMRGSKKRSNKPPKNTLKALELFDAQQ